MSSLVLRRQAAYAPSTMPTTKEMTCVTTTSPTVHQIAWPITSATENG